MDENDSPFAHVPAANAGPGPLQEGPFTIERMVASTGSGSVEGARWQKYVVALSAAVVLAGLVVAVVAVLVAR